MGMPLWVVKAVGTHQRPFPLGIARFIQLFSYILKGNVDTRSKILIGLFILLVVGTGIWKYYVYFVQEDFTVHSVISCDVATESCFSVECAEDDEECDDTPYKKLESSARLIPECDPYIDDTCPEPVCEEGENECTITVCSVETLEEGEICLPIDESASDEEVVEESDL